MLLENFFSYWQLCDMIEVIENLLKTVVRLTKKGMILIMGRILKEDTKILPWKSCHATDIPVQETFYSYLTTCSTSSLLLSYVCL